MWLAPDNSPRERQQHCFAPILLSVCQRHIKALFPAPPSPQLWTVSSASCKHNGKTLSSALKRILCHWRTTVDVHWAPVYQTTVSLSRFLNFIFFSPRKQDIHLQAKNTLTNWTLTSIISGGWLLLYLRFQAVPILPNLSWLRWSLGWFTKLNNTGSFVWNERQEQKKVYFNIKTHTHIF